MQGYHYTSKERWRLIKKEGLKPKVVSNVEVISALRPLGITQLFGIWVWTKRLVGYEHAVFVMRTAAILSTHIPSSQIKLIGEYNITERLK